MKRKAIILICKEQKANCVILQETHSAEADTKFWKLKWGDPVFFGHGTSHSAGVMILFNSFPGNVNDCKSDSKGQWLMVVSEINGSNYIVLCVYGYTNRAQKKLLSFLFDKLEQWKLSYLVDKVIVEGDFNVVPDPFLDRFPSRASCHKLFLIWLPKSVCVTIGDWKILLRLGKLGLIQLITVNVPGLITGSFQTT